MKMECRRARTAVRAVVLARQRIHGILPQITFLRGQLHGFAPDLGERDLVGADRTVHIKQNAAGILTDGLRFIFGDRDILIHDFQSVSGERTLLLVLQRSEDNFVDIIRDFSRRAADEFDE